MTTIKVVLSLCYATLDYYIHPKNLAADFQDLLISSSSSSSSSIDNVCLAVKKQTADRHVIKKKKFLVESRFAIL